MLAHRLRHRVAVQQVVEAQNPDTGARTELWVDYQLTDGTLMNAVPAEVLTGAGREYVQSGATQSEYNARMNLRWFPNLNTKMRIVWDGSTYDIVSIETDATARQEYRLKVISTGPLVAPEEIDLVWSEAGVYYYQ